jgi:hypothetical protein
VKPVREPDAGNLQVRFDERQWETEPQSRLRHRRLAKAAGNSDSLGLKSPRPPSTLPGNSNYRVVDVSFPYARARGEDVHRAAGEPVP